MMHLFWHGGCSSWRSSTPVNRHFGLGVVSLLGVCMVFTAAAAAAAVPSCELCGCSQCQQGQFPVGDSSATFPIEGSAVVDQLPLDAAAVLQLLANNASPLHPSCELMAGAVELWEDFECVTAWEPLRLDPDMRAICGCPPLPAPTISNLLADLYEQILTAFWSLVDFFWIFE